MRVFNPAKTPIVVDGRVVGGREHVDIKSSDRARVLVAKGFLIEKTRRSAAKAAKPTPKVSEEKETKR